MMSNYAQNHIQGMRLIRFVAKYTNMDYKEVGRIAEAVAFGAIEPNHFDYLVTCNNDKIKVTIWRDGDSVTINSTCFSDEINEIYPNQNIRSLTEQIADGVGVE